MRVGDQQGANGVLLVGIKPEREVETWQIQLLETLGKHTAISFDVSRRVAQHRRLALLEERNLIARKLHDSLAQSLTYLRIQATRLSRLMKSAGENNSVDDAIADLKEGLDSAYRQLRELLTTFRLKMHEQGLGPALTKAVDELNARGSVEEFLDNKLEVSPFSVNEEIHVLQLVREALSNAERHAKATQVTVRLDSDDEAFVRVSVEDNGIGIPNRAERDQHYGLAIMQERAASLQGDLRIERQPRGGTRVCLRFQPKTRKQNNVSARVETTT